MTFHAPNPRPTGPVNDMDAGAFFGGVAFLAAVALAWPALVLIYSILSVLLGGGAVAPVLPSLSSVLWLVMVAVLTGLVSGLIRLKLQNRSRYLADLVEAVLGAVSAGQITFSAILLNLAIGAAIGLTLSFMGVSSPFDVHTGSEILFATGGAIAIALSGGGGSSPPEWWDILLMLFLLVSLLGAVFGIMTAALFAWIGSTLGAEAGKGGSEVGAALVLSLTRLWRMHPNPAWQPEKPLPREIGDLMSELEVFEQEVWQREPRRDLLEDYRKWLIGCGHNVTVPEFIEFLPEHRAWLREHGTTKGQRYLGAFADWLHAIMTERANIASQSPS